MDERRTEQTPLGTHTTINQTEPKSTGNGVMWFLMGGVVVVIAIIGYFMLGDGNITGMGASQSDGGNVSINVDTNDAPAETAPAETSPAETAPPPAETAPPAD